MFFKGQLVWQTASARGSKYKFVSPAAVLSAMKAGVVDSGWLAPGVIRTGSTAHGDFAVMIILPAGRVTVPVERDGGKGVEDLTLHLPAFAFIGHGKRYHVFALKSAADPSRAPLFHAPLPNVFEDGRICWGSNTPPESSGSAIAGAWLLFLAAPFNGHAAEGKVKGEAGDLRPFLRKLARSRAKFPLEVLMPIGGYTLDDAVSAIIGEQRG